MTSSSRNKCPATLVCILATGLQIQPIRVQHDKNDTCLTRQHINEGNPGQYTLQYSQQFLPVDKMSSSL